MSAVAPWPPDEVGVLRLPSGLLVRGRGLRHPVSGGTSPTFGLYLLGRRPPATEWPQRWLRWPDFLLPLDSDDAVAAIREAHDRSESDRVEVACGGGLGRTGTVLACMAVLDGLPPSAAIRYVREHYRRRAVETPWQRRFVTRFG